ncbi:flagellar protein FlaG [Arcobacter sp. FWKO B]|uniref:flagellar protein FlaG n=1 Tax=Arcobacter sp. FWKO B TaxID=2593672 RepID=UPI0018A38C18|nr:flagellar protein FlaG [Arcobacter sp. FWKO B]QOG11672.1 flagellar protein FlaG [Arcobacter sp. FWKO B]
MELGRIAQMDSYRDNVVQASQKVEPVKESLLKVKNDLEGDQKSTSDKIKEMNEVVLNSARFGFNDKSGDFYVKIMKEDKIIAQYPSEQVMKLRSYAKELQGS